MTANHIGEPTLLPLAGDDRASPKLGLACWLAKQVFIPLQCWAVWGPCEASHVQGHKDKEKIA